MKFILMLLSVYRITYMIVYETGPLSIFERIRTFTFSKSYGESSQIAVNLFGSSLSESYFWANVDEGINCPYCVSVWISGIVWMISRIKGLNKIFLGIFGLSGAYLVLQQIMDRIEDDE